MAMRNKWIHVVSVGLCTLAAVAVVGFSSAWADATNAGQAVLVTGDVTGTIGAVVKHVIIHQDVVHDEAIATDPSGATQIDFVDGTKLTVGPGAHVIIDKFVYNPNTSNGVMALSVTEGVFRFVTGKMPHDAYSIATPNGTLGVRGTDFEFVVANGTTIVKVISGAVVGKIGNVEQILQNGCFTMTAQEVIVCSPNDQLTLAQATALMEALLTQPTAGPPPGTPGYTPPNFVLPPASPH